MSAPMLSFKEQWKLTGRFHFQVYKTVPYFTHQDTPAYSIEFICANAYQHLILILSSEVNFAFLPFQGWQKNSCGWVGVQWN